MTYFTILHWITLLILFIIFIIFNIIALKQTNKKILVSMIFSNFLVISMLAVFSMFVLDKYTKIARLENVSQKRVLMNESFAITGQIRNIGRFDIGQCKLEVKLVNNAITNSQLGGSNVFKPTSGLSELFGRKTNQKPSTVIKEFVIAKNFKSGELRNFTVMMRYPAYFEKTSLFYKLYCH
ncbi:DUF2393 family protein [Sulfurospirillum sp. 1307]|jgi:hypothetical protein